MGPGANNDKMNADQVLLLEAVVARGPGWQQAFAVLIGGYHSYLYHRCMRHLGNAADAEDVLQEVYLSAFRFAGSFERRAKLKTWLTRIADNQCYTFLRKRQQQINLEHLLTVIEIHENAIDTPVPETLDHCKKLVAEVMAKVSPKAREILSLRYWLDLPVEQIAQTLGIGLSATKMRLHRAHQQCFSEIDAQGSPPARLPKVVGALLADSL